LHRKSERMHPCASPPVLVHRSSVRSQLCAEWVRNGVKNGR
jgi:hypothetical protein